MAEFIMLNIVVVMGYKITTETIIPFVSASAIKQHAPKHVLKLLTLQQIKEHYVGNCRTISM